MPKVKHEKLKDYIERELQKLGSDDEKIPVSEYAREWLAEAGILDVIVQAIKGEEIDKQKLKLRDRVHFAIKMANKIMPDMKSVEQKRTETHSLTIKHTATHDLLAEVLGKHNTIIGKAEVIEDEG